MSHATARDSKYEGNLRISECRMSYVEPARDSKYKENINKIGMSNVESRANSQN